MAKKVVVVRVGEKITQIVHMESVANNSLPYLDVSVYRHAEAFLSVKV